MTYFRIGGGSSLSSTEIMTIFVVLCILGIVVWIAYFFIKSKDNSQPLHTEKVKILEKPIKQGNIEWYVVEFENGERKRLRSFHGLTVLITVGDEGIIEYRGITIQSFRPLKKESEK